ncbi:MAG TPA: DUF5946 family protein [Chloroflexia bacterium]|nr:DUF5946 family protein [Chloroflexia bacterium]
MTEIPGLIPCIGCGALVPNTNGPTHRYIGASPGCWQAYSELLARGYGSDDAPAYGAMSRITVDIYAAQHPGVPGKQSSQSVCAHLFILCLVLEHDLDLSFATAAITRFIEKHKGHNFPWLEPPASLGPITVLDLLNATDAGDYDRKIRLWAESVWGAWEPHHATIRAWADAWESEAGGRRSHAHG